MTGGSITCTQVAKGAEIIPFLDVPVNFTNLQQKARYKRVFVKKSEVWAPYW